MSITDLIPVRFGLLDRAPLRTRHRAPDEIARLQFLLFGANLCIKGLRLQLDEKDDRHAEVVRRIDERHAEVVRGLERELADAHSRLGIACKANAAADETQEFDASSLQERFASGRVVSLPHSPLAATKRDA